MEYLKVKYQNNITWFYNLQYILFSVMLVILVTLIDLRIINLHQYLQSVMTTSINLAKSILTTLAGSLLTITTCTFSTILVVINMYTNTYTPRVVENFINKKIAMKVLGIFIGGFVYCITSLLFMRDYFEKQVVVAGFVGVVYSIICIAYFVIFVQTVIKNFQGVNLISEISQQAAVIVKKEVQARTTIAVEKH